MKILIADDMEGVTGVVAWKHVDPEHAEYQRYRRLMTGDVNAAIRGAFKGGADEVVVADGHNGGRNILIEELDPRAKLNSGSPSRWSMVQSIDESVDAVIFVGYHARAGTLNAVLCHTWTTNIINVWLNDRPVGEIGVNASLCGHFGAPLLMISGDRAACAEAREWAPEVETAVVKTASGRYAAECLPPAVTCELIEQAAESAVKRFAQGQGPKPLVTERPVRMRIAFSHPAQADSAGLMPNAARVDGYTVEMTAPDMPTAYRSFRAAATLGN